MIPNIENCYFLSRKDNIIFANLIDGEQVPLVRLKQKFIDLLVLERQAYDYMLRYMEMFPHHWELIEEKQEKQLTLF